MPQKYTPVFNTIARRAAKSGISLKQLCERVGVTQQMLQGWKHRTPKTLDTYFKFDEELRKLEEKQDA